MSSIFIRFPFPFPYKLVNCEHIGIQSSLLHNIISSKIRRNDFSLYCNGKEIPAGFYVLPNSTVYVSFSLPGGKGGFGSMLRAIGAQIEKTTNREACRDLSGRRLRDVNEEQRLKNWISKKGERESEKMRRRKERLERLKSRPKHNFVDFEYEKEISELPERIDDALSAGMEKVKKRPPDINEPSTSGSIKKKRLWLDEDISESSESDSDSSSLKSNEESGEPQEGNDADELLRPQSAENTSCSSKTSECNATSYDADQMDSYAFGSQSKVDREFTTTSDSTPDSVADNTLDSKGSLKNSTNSLKDDDEKVSPIDLNDYKNVMELESLGLERLKNALMLRGLKCGGSLVDRAARLWAVRSLDPDQYPKNLLAKCKK